MDNTLNKKDIIKFVIFSVFLVSMIICGIIFYPKIKEYISFENVRLFVEKNKFLSFSLNFSKTIHLKSILSF